MSGTKQKSGRKPQPGYEALVAEIYHRAISEFRFKRRRGLATYDIERFLLSGAYQVDPDAVAAILKRLEEETA